jgi:aldose 1-epimerase
MAKIGLFYLSNGVVEVAFTNYGCTIVSINVPDKNGQKSNIVAGFKSLEEYKNNEHYLGCTVGRFANLIAFGKVEIDGIHYHLACNNGVNHL